MTRPWRHPHGGPEPSHADDPPGPAPCAPRAAPRARQVEGFVVAGSFKLVLVGLAGGTVAALLLTRLLRGLLYGIEPTHPVAYAAAALLLAGVAGCASWIPARGAARVDAVVALRAE